MTTTIIKKKDSSSPLSLPPNQKNNSQSSTTMLMVSNRPKLILGVTLAVAVAVASEVSGSSLGSGGGTGRFANRTIAAAMNPPPSPASLIPFIFVTSDAFLDICSNSDAIQGLISKLHPTLLYLGVPSPSLPSADEIVLSLCAMVVTLIAYFFLFGKRHVRRRRKLAEELKLAQLQVHYLEERLNLAQGCISETSQDGKKKEIRVFMDGAFDMMHYGHMNAFRLGRSLGTHLIVGVNSDESITTCKGAPLMNDEERMTMVSGCKFVDQVVPNCPYVMSSEYLDYVFDKYQVDFVIHGDDPCIVDGKDVYAAAKAKGKYLSIPRTEGVSTTDFIGRMLILTKEHHHKDNGNKSGIAKNDEMTLLGRQSKFLTTSRMLRLFSAGVKTPTKDMKVIYMDGAWDMFHCGHVKALQEAKKRGDYLIVGVHGDALVNKMRGSNLPLMNLHERVLSLLGCRFVDDVVIDAPYTITNDMIASLNISEVVHGNITDSPGGVDDGDRYLVPEQKGILHIINSPSKFTMSNIVTRIKRNQDTFQAKFERKMKAENAYYDERYNKANKR